MTVTLSLARSCKEHEEVFRLRHDVLVDEEGYLSAQSDGRVFDEFDAKPGVGTVIARVDGMLVGSARVMKRGEGGTAAERYFDFGPYLRGQEILGSANFLVVRRAYRHIPGLTLSLVSFCYRWSMAHGLTHLIAALNPKVASRFIECGWQRVDEIFYDTEHGVWVQPALLAMSDLSARCRERVGDTWGQESWRWDYKGERYACTEMPSLLQ